MRFFDRSFVISACLICLGWSSWITVNGVWAETPLLVSSLPEGWTLPSYIIVITQLANVGPLIYSLLHRRYKNIQTVTIHLILVLGIVGSLLLSCFWSVTGNVFGADRSTAFLGLLFIFSLVDCTTSVLYIPYLSKFQSKFVFPLFVGEGLSGLIPSIISLVQGTADAAGDHHGLYFSVSTYFVILSVLLAISWLAFWLLNSDHFIDDFRRTSTVPGERTPIFNGPRTNNQTNNHSASDPSPVIQVSITTASSPVHPLSPHQTLALLVLQALTSCFANSVLSGLQTYTAMPYGLSAYHLACNLALFASPSASLLAFFFDPNPIDTNSPMSAIESNNLHYFDLPTNDQSTCGRGWKRLVAGDQRMFSLQLSTVIQFICAAYLLALAAVHKNVPAIDSWLGPTLMISAWVGFSFFASLCKTLICSLLRTRGSESSLFRYGVYTQVGSLLGAVPTFVVTNFTNYFR